MSVYGSRKRSALRSWSRRVAGGDYERYRFTVIREMRKHFGLSVEDAAHLVDSNAAFVGEAYRSRVEAGKTADAVAQLTVRAMGTRHNPWDVETRIRRLSLASSRRYLKLPRRPWSSR